MGKVYKDKQHKKKLSWSYRHKKKLAKTNESQETNNVQVQNKKARIIVRNLSFKASESDIRQLYEPFGQIEEIKLLKRPDGKLVGCGFVQFKRVEDASKAIFNTNKTELLGRTISSEWAISKDKFVEKLNKNEKPIDIDTEQPDVDKNECQEKETKKNKYDLTKQEQRKLHKLKKTMKRSRIVLRNLSFKATEDSIREHFGKFGDIDEVKILTKEDGVKVGCAFVQFNRVQSAAQAIHWANMKPFFERPLVVDWAQPKNKFEKSQPNAENTEDIKDIKIEDESDTEVKNEKSDSDESDNESSKSDDEDTNEDEFDDTVKKEDFELDLQDKVRKPLRLSNDISEGRTVFIKNIPFAATNEELRECMLQFGPVYYALICIDRMTEHSKGTAFVKFRNVEDAEKCLNAGTELKLHDQILDPHQALDRKDVQGKSSIKNKNDKKDSRNLYLVKEGVVLAGSPAAKGVSASDMARRLELEQWKSKMLKNLNMFISRVRLIVHNIPPNVDDSMLRKIFKNHSPPNAIIKEARVMRDLKNRDVSKIGNSKGFGFITYTNHEDALKVLRCINNNPNVFSAQKRPIVAFSVESRTVMNAKQKRMKVSQERNPLFKNKEGPKEDNGPKKKRQKIDSVEDKTEDVKSFTGVESQPGITKLRTKFNLKRQAEIHTQALKTEKKQRKILKQTILHKKEMSKSRKEPKPKQGPQKMDADEVNFNNLVNSYRNKLLASNQVKEKTKWYET